MNNRFSLKNFRVFDEKGAEFEIAPITVLTGCNSSGKSSVIKSLMLLKQYFNTIKNDYANNKSIEITDYELLFNKGKHNLGSYEKSFSKHSKENNLMTFGWTTYSHLMLCDLKVEINFIENHKNILNNGVVKSIKISKDTNEIVFLNFEDGIDFKIDSQIFKSHFFRFVELVKKENDIVENLGWNYSFGTTNYFNSDRELFEKSDLSFSELESLIYAKTKLIERDKINELVNDCKAISDEVIEHKSILYLPILDWLKGKNKEEAYEIILGKIDEVKLNNESIIQNVMSLILEFQKSNFKTFSEFYFDQIENKLAKCFIAESDSNQDENANCNIDKMIAFDKWNWSNTAIRGDENDLKEFHKYSLSASNSFIQFLENFLSIDHPFISQSHLFDFNNMGDDKLYISDEHSYFMSLATICILIDEKFKANYFKKIEYRPIANDAIIVEPKIYNTAIKYILGVIQDTIFNVPSFIDNVEFVDVVRADVQRIYLFSQKSEFNDLIQSYLNPTLRLEDKNTLKIKSKRGFTLVVGEENGERVFNLQRELIDNNENSNEKKHEVPTKYKLGTFMNKWLKKFDIADGVTFENRNDGIGILINLTKGNVKEPLADQGYGISQLLAILLKIETTILKSEYEYSHQLIGVREIRFNKTTISIEEPETSLHPKFQSMLADLLLDAYRNYNIHFIVETHSEYLIRKLQTLVAKKEITPNDVSLQYIYNADPEKRAPGKPHVEKINIKNDGRLDKPFGAGFFDEADNLAMDLLIIKSLN